jgi:hypothetical protein
MKRTGVFLVKTYFEAKVRAKEIGMDLAIKEAKRNEQYWKLTKVLLEEMKDRPSKKVIS